VADIDKVSRRGGKSASVADLFSNSSRGRVGAAGLRKKVLGQRVVLPRFSRIRPKGIVPHQR